MDAGHSRFPNSPLTPRESEILRLMSQGLSNPQIATSLYLSINTIKTFINNIFHKLSVSNRRDAIDKANQMGWLGLGLEIAASSVKHNLPASSSSFFGRESEINDLNRLLNNPTIRLLTLVGIGGVGKTRLAFEVAADQIENYVHGVFFIT